MGRIGMSQKELRRVEVLARVKSRDLKVMVSEWQDGMVEIEYRGRKLPWKEISSAPRRPSGSNSCLPPGRHLAPRPSLKSGHFMC